MALTKIKTDGLGDSAVTSAKINDGSIVNDDINATFDLSSKTVTLPSASVTAHATNPTKTSIEALGIDLPAADLTGTINSARLGTGTAGSGNFLRGDGAWEAAGGGKVLQVVSSGGFSATASTASTSWTYTGHSVTITPASGSKVLLMLNGGGGRADRAIGYSQARVVTTLYRGSTNLGNSGEGLSQQKIKAEVSSTSGSMVAPHSIIHLDASPGGDGSTAITYKIYYKSPDATTIYYSYVTEGRVELVAMEIGA